MENLTHNQADREHWSGKFPRSRQKQVSAAVKPSQKAGSQTPGRIASPEPGKARPQTISSRNLSLLCLPCPPNPPPCRLTSSPATFRRPTVRNEEARASQLAGTRQVTCLKLICSLNVTRRKHILIQLSSKHVFCSVTTPLKRNCYIDAILSTNFGHRSTDF